MLENQNMVDRSLPILADRPEVGPCLDVFFRQPLRWLGTESLVIAAFQ